MKKSFFMILMALLALPAFSQTSTGSINVQTDYTLTAQGLAGQTGIHLTINNVSVGGFQGRDILFYCVLGKGDQWISDLSASFTAKGNAGAQATQWPSLWFEFTNERIQELLGEGTHDLFAAFGAYDPDHPESPLPGSWVTTAFSITLGEAEEEEEEEEEEGAGPFKVLSIDGTQSGDNVTLKVRWQSKDNAEVLLTPFISKAGKAVTQGTQVGSGRLVMSNQIEKTFEWTFSKADFASLGDGEHRLDVKVQGMNSHKQDLGTFPGNIVVKLGQAKPAGNTYSFKTPVYSVEIPGYSEYADGVIGGRGTITFTNQGTFTCDMYVHRKFVGGTTPYTNVPQKIRATPTTGNVIWQLGPIYIDNMINWEMTTGLENNGYVGLSMISGKLSMNINNTPVKMLNPGRVEFEVTPGFVKATSQAGYSDASSIFNVGAYQVPNAKLQLTSDMLKIEAQSQANVSKGQPHTFWWKIEGGRYSLSYVGPADQMENVKRTGVR